MRSRERLLTPRFLLIIGAGLCYFLALSMLTPVIPHYVEDELGGGSIAVGIAVGALFLGAVALRPVAGRIGDRVGRRSLIIGGAAIVATSTALYGVVPSVAYLVAMRLLTGVGEAAFFVGAATMVTDLAPEHRRGEALSYWSVSVYGGLAFGPALGENVLGSARFELTWSVSAALAAVAALLGLATVEVVRGLPTGPPTRLIHPAAVGPGTVLFLGLIGLSGFTAFVPLYVDRIGLGGADGIFLLYGGLILCIRILGAKLPDRLGARRAGTAALVSSACGLGVIAAWPSVGGLVAGTAIFATGMSLLYPALLLLAIAPVPDRERASVVGTVTSFFDLSQGLGAFLLGAVVAVSGYRGAFAAGALASMIGFLVLRVGVTSRARAARIAGGGDATEAVPA